MKVKCICQSHFNLINVIQRDGVCFSTFVAVTWFKNSVTYLSRKGVGCWCVSQLSLISKVGVPGARRPNATCVNINMSRIRIYVTQVRTQHRLKTKLREKQIFRP